MSRNPHLRSGASLVEALFALVLTSIAGTILVHATVTQLRLGTRVVTTGETTDALWTAASLIDAEIRAARIESDVSPGSADTLALRAFRATLIACDTTADETVLRTAGIRLPDPAKDSLLIEKEGQWFAAAFAIAAAPATHSCLPAPGETVTAMRITPRLHPGAVALLFEHGSYHLDDGALRWRAGGAGRQPVTAQVFDGAASGFSAESSALILDLATRLPATPRTAPRLLRLLARPLNPDGAR